MRTIVYVDGHNLYYGLLRNSAHKWLDLFALFQNHLLGPDTELIEVRYYTSPVLGKVSDDPESPLRQRLYLQALRKMPPRRVCIIEGKMVMYTSHLRLAKPLPLAPSISRIQVCQFREKNTDINLAADLITGAWLGAYEQAVICTNDSDLTGALAAVRKHHPRLSLGIVAPIPGTDHRRLSNSLMQHASWGKILSPVHLENAQLPERIPGTSILKPEKWRK
jgi:hypothetical protein